MKRFLTTLAAAALLCPLASVARTDPDTAELIGVAKGFGATVSYNDSEYCWPGIEGMFDSSKKLIVICHDGWPTDNDHDTVRHEMFHFAQSCAAEARGYKTLQPILTKPGQLSTWVKSVLTDDQIVSIKSNYPRAKWRTELEAAAAAQNYTAADIALILHLWCKD